MLRAGQTGEVGEGGRLRRRGEIGVSVEVGLFGHDPFCVLLLFVWYVVVVGWNGDEEGWLCW